MCDTSASPRYSVSLFERFSCMRRNLGLATAITVVVAYPSGASLPSETFLSSRITELQDHFPLFRAELRDAHTREPYFQQKQAQWAPSDILSRFVYQPLDQPLREKEKLLYDEVERMQKEDLATRSAWQISIYTPASGEGLVYLTTSVDHVLTDVVGLMRLTTALLSPDIAHLPTESISSIRRMEDTIDTRPDYTLLVPTAFRELLLPRLPRFVQAYLESPRPWPGRAFAVSPNKVPSASSLVEIPIDIVSRVKADGKSREVLTLHPIIMTAYLVAMWHVVRRDYEGSPNPFVLRGASPRSERLASLGHPYCTANHISQSAYDKTFTPEDDFWMEARKAAESFSDPTERKKALGKMGLLSYIPDPDPTKSEFKHGPTGWEDFFMGAIEGKGNFGDSLGFTNLGYVDLPEGAVDLAWNQGAWPLGQALLACAIGHKGGLRIVTVWREGSAVIRDQVKEVEKVFGAILGRLADMKRRGTSLGELVASVDRSA